MLLSGFTNNMRYPYPQLLRLRGEIKDSCNVGVPLTLLRMKENQSNRNQGYTTNTLLTPVVSFSA